MSTQQHIPLPFSVYCESGYGQLIGAHAHEQAMEIIELTRGKATVYIGTARFEANAGDFFFVPAAMVHRLFAQEKCDVRGLVFDVSILQENMIMFDTEVLYMFYIQSKNRISGFSPEHPIYPLLCRYMDDSFEEFSAKDVCYLLPIRANIYLMMTALLRHYCGTKNDQDRMIYHNVLRMRPVMEYIDAHYTGKIYVEALAGMLNVSPDYFTRMFRESIGKTPIDYINDLRVNRAMALLAGTGDTMAQIAEQIGFCNPNYFHKIFKQYMDMSPLSYRKMNRETE